MKHKGPDLVIIVPTLNERDNIIPLVEELDSVLAGIDWEVIFVDDDSRDGTAELVRELSRTDHRVRCLQRLNRRGLSSGCIEGMLASSAPYIAVMDGDLQHDPAILPTMKARLESSGADIAVGSRFTEGGGVGGWDSGRLAISRLAKRIGRPLLPDGLADPMSGFFMIKRTVLEEVVRSLSGLGFKLLVDIFASATRELRFVEVPYEFRQRKAGASKLDSVVAWEYLMLLADKLVGRFIPVRFLAFSAVGAMGLFVHLAVLTAVYALGGASFVVGQATATVLAMIFNFSINNVLTYRDRRRTGWRWLSGLLSFMLACGVGALANVGIAA